MFLAFNTTSDENGNKDIEKKRNSFYEKLKTLSLQHPFWQISLLSSHNYVVKDHRSLIAIIGTLISLEIPIQSLIMATFRCPSIMCM